MSKHGPLGVPTIPLLFKREPALQGNPSTVAVPVSPAPPPSEQDCTHIYVPFMCRRRLVTREDYRRRCWPFVAHPKTLWGKTWRGLSSYGTKKCSFSSPLLRILRPLQPPHDVKEDLQACLFLRPLQPGRPVTVSQPFTINDTLELPLLIFGGGVRVVGSLVSITCNLVPPSVVTPSSPVPPPPICLFSKLSYT